MNSTFPPSLSDIERWDAEAAEEESSDSVSTISQEVVLEGPTFEAFADFDTGEPPLGAKIVSQKFTVLTLDGGGATFGDGAGEIGIGFITPVPVGTAKTQAGLDEAATGMTYGSFFIDNSQTNTPGFIDEVGGWERIVSPRERWVRVAVAIVDNDSANSYAGGDDPSATVRLDVQYI